MNVKNSVSVQKYANGEFAKTAGAKIAYVNVPKRRVASIEEIMEKIENNDKNEENFNSEHEKNMFILY